MADAPRGSVVEVKAGERVRSPIGGDVRFIVRGAESDGRLAALETLIPPGEGPPLHVHTREDETIHITAGEVRMKLDGELFSAPTGSFVFIPRGVPHAFQVMSDEPARLTITFTPAGMEEFFDHLADLEAFDLEAFKDGAAKVGMEVVGPQLAESDPV